MEMGRRFRILGVEIESRCGDKEREDEHHQTITPNHTIHCNPPGGLPYIA